MNNNFKNATILVSMKNSIDKIRNIRITTGEDPTNQVEIWEEINVNYEKLNREYQEKFNDYII